MCVTTNDRCCCCHVKVGVEVLGWVGVALNSVASIGALLNHSTTNLVGAVLGVLLYLGLIVAKRTESHRWYLPFLVLNGMYVGLVAVILAVFAVLVASGRTDEMLSLAEHAYTDSGYDQVPVRMGTFVTTTFAFLGITLVWTAYCEYVVLRAYKNIKRQSGEMPPHAITKA